MTLIMIIDEKSFFDVPVKDKEEAYEKIMGIRNTKNHKLVKWFQQWGVQICYKMS